MRIAITGNIGSGKSLFSQLLSAELPGRSLLDVDSLSAGLYQNPDFQSQLVSICGTTDRKQVSNLCFSNSAIRHAVELASLPVWHRQLQNHLSPPNLIVEFPLLFETAQYVPYFDLIISVSAEEQLRSDRVTARSGWPVEKINNAFKAQLSAFSKNASADILIINEGSLEDLKLKAAQLAKEILAFESLRFKNIPVTVQKQIARKYLEPQRHYHTLSHLANIEKSLAPFWDQFHHQDAAQMAILFHDFVYDTSISQYMRNEQHSIQAMWQTMSDFCAEQLVMDLSLSTDNALTLASELIAATKKHTIDSPWLLAKKERQEDCALFLDADLSVLAADRAELIAYDQGIRDEFIHVPLDIYKSERIKALNSFLIRPQIFLSAAFKPQEKKARENLHQLIQLTQERV